MAFDFGMFIPDVGAVGTFIGVFGWVFVFGAVVYLIWYLFSYNVKVIINNTFSGKAAEEDKARWTRAKGDKTVKTLKLLRNKHDFFGAVPEHHQKQLRKSFNRIGTIIYMERDQHGTIYSIPPPYGDEFHVDTAIPPQLREWTKIKTREAALRYTRENFWLQYAPLLISITGFLIVGVIMMVVSRDLGSVAEAFNNAASAYKDAMVAQQVVS